MVWDTLNLGFWVVSVRKRDFFKERFVEAPYFKERLFCYFCQVLRFVHRNKQFGWECQQPMVAAIQKHPLRTGSSFTSRKGQFLGDTPKNPNDRSAGDRP